MPIITAWAALFCGALFFALTVRVIMARRESKVSLGDGENPILERRMRGQGNAAEQMPITLICLGAAELMGAPSLILVLAAVVFCLGRLGHGIAFGWMTFSVLRMYGFAASATGTLLALISLAWALLS